MPDLTEQRAALEKAEHGVIYLAPRCCADPHEGRHWCQDDVWPCADCPHRVDPTPPRGVRYVLAATGREAEAAQVREAGDG